MSNWNLPVPDLSAFLAGRWNQPSCGAGNTIILGQFSAFAPQLPFPSPREAVEQWGGEKQWLSPFLWRLLAQEMRKLEPWTPRLTCGKKWSKNDSLQGTEMGIVFARWGGEAKNPKETKAYANNLLFWKQKDVTISLDWNLVGFLVLACWCMWGGPEQCSPEHDLNSQTNPSSWLCPSNCLEYRGVQSFEALMLIEPGLFMP